MNLIEEGESSQIDNEAEASGEFYKDILIDNRKLKQIQKENFSLTSYSGFNVKTLERLGIKPRKHHLYYGLNIQERALDISLTSNKVIIPLLTKKDVSSRMQKLPPEVRNTLGWVHIGAIQIIIKGTFKPGLDTPLDLAIMDNRIRSRQEACLGIIRGNLRYGKLIFTLRPKLAYHLRDKDFDKTLSLLQNFRRKDFFLEENTPYSITFAISYGLSNTHHSDCFAIKETIDYPMLFDEVCSIQLPDLPLIEEIESLPLQLDLQEKPLLISNRLPPRLSFTDTHVSSRPLQRSTSNLIVARNHEASNYKIDSEYFNGKKFTPIKILIDTGANGNYISSKFCIHLQRFDLESPHLYTNFNGETHEISQVVETLLRYGSEIIPIRLLIQDSELNENLEIMLGNTFLEMVKPYQITSNGLKITYNGKMIYIPK